MAANIRHYHPCLSRYQKKTSQAKTASIRPPPLSFSFHLPLLLLCHIWIRGITLPLISIRIDSSHQAIYLTAGAFTTSLSASIAGFHEALVLATIFFFRRSTAGLLAVGGVVTYTHFYSCRLSSEHVFVARIIPRVLTCIVPICYIASASRSTAITYAS